MRVGVTLAVLGCLALAGASPAQQSPRSTYEALNSLRIDSRTIYRVENSNRIELRRSDVKISFDEGRIAFFQPANGKITGAVFAGRGHILAIPRDPAEKQQMARFLGAPVLDQDFLSVYLRFTDDTAAELQHQLENAKLTAEEDSAFAERWNPLLAQLNAQYSLRILADSLTTHPQPFFYGGFNGLATGPFDVLLDFQRAEALDIGQTRRTEKGIFYDVWVSYAVPDAPVPRPAFRATQYTIDASVLANNSLEGTAAIKLRTESDGEQVLAFQLARELRVESVTGEDGQPLVFFQNEGLSTQDRALRGNDFVYALLPAAPSAGKEFTLHFKYQGNVIVDAGNGVLFVGARESWYPRYGDTADFADYDLTMRWPRKLRLAATGAKIDEHEEGNFRTGHWRTERPVAVAGFNLGEYAFASLASQSYSIDVYANRQLEQALSSRLSVQIDDATPRFPGLLGEGRIQRQMELSLPPPSPADALKQLSREIDSSIHFYETYSGPFPFHHLNVSQIPGTFGQGWPGLLYLSTYSFLPATAQQRAGLSAKAQEHFSELVPFHEVAHQWWGNVVGWSSYRDQWIDEAIANYLALLFADTQKNPDHTLRVWLARYRDQLVEKTPEQDGPAGEIGPLILGGRLSSSKSPDGFDRVIYSKGSWVIHMLREMLRQPGTKNPDARFAGLLRTLTTKYANRALTTADLQHEVEAVMTPQMDLEGGRSMEWFFDEWVNGTGVPRYHAEFAVKRGETGNVVRGKLYQSGVPRSFVARVPLYVSSGGKTVFLGNVLASGPETPFHFPVTGEVKKILIDPQMTLLCVAE